MAGMKTWIIVIETAIIAVLLGIAVAGAQGVRLDDFLRGLRFASDERARIEAKVDANAAAIVALSTPVASGTPTATATPAPGATPTATPGGSGPGAGGISPTRTIAIEPTPETGGTPAPSSSATPAPSATPDAQSAYAAALAAREAACDAVRTASDAARRVYRQALRDAEAAYLARGRALTAEFGDTRLVPWEASTWALFHASRETLVADNAAALEAFNAGLVPLVNACNAAKAAEAALEADE